MILTKTYKTTKKMKKTLLVLLSICIYEVNAQISSTRISYISPNKDTLMFPNNETGEAILKVWDDQKYSKNRPFIAIVPESVIRSKNYYYLINEEKKRNNINHIHTTN
jgi:hypothetical protein